MGKEGLKRGGKGSLGSVEGRQCCPAVPGYFGWKNKTRGGEGKEEGLWMEEDKRKDRKGRDLLENKAE